VLCLTGKDRMRSKNEKTEAVIEIEIIHIWPCIPETYIERPTPYRSRNAVYRNIYNGAYTREQLEEIKKAVDMGLSGSQIIEISDPELTPELIAMARDIALEINENGDYEDDDDDLEDEGIWAR